MVAETLPSGFRYVQGSVTPSTIVAGVVGQTVSFTLSGQTSFSYRVAASSVGGLVLLLWEFGRRWRG